MKKCEDCRYWEDFGVINSKNFEPGTCKRYPPSGPTGYYDNFEGVSDFPMTRNDDWCGEFKEKEEENVPTAKAIVQRNKRLGDLLGGTEENKKPAGD